MERVPDNYLEVGKKYPVTIVKLLANGAIVAIEGTNYSAFIHVSKLSRQYVANVADAVTVGCSYLTECIDKGRGAELRIVNIVDTVVDTPSLDSMIQAADRALFDKRGRDAKTKPSRTRRKYKRKDQNCD